MASADTSVFSLRIGSHPLNTFRVLEFHGEEALSRLFSFRIRAVVFDKILAYEDAVDAEAELIVRGADFEVIHHGVITQFTQVPESDGTVALNFYYEFTLEPRLKSLTHVVQSRIFQNMTAKEIVLQVLEDYYPNDGKWYDFQAADAFPQREYTVQYNESDLDFIQRLMEDEGVYYYFDHEGGQEKMVMANKPDKVRPIANTPEVPYRPQSGLNHDQKDYADTLCRVVKRVTSKAVLKDFNPKTPETTVMGSHTNPVLPDSQPTGEYYQYGGYLNSADEATRKAKLRAEMLSCAVETFQGTGIFRSARAGFRFKLGLADAEGFNGEYLLTRVVHLGDLDQGAGGAGDPARQPVPRYRNSFECVKASVTFRPPLATPKPKVPGLLTAFLDGQKDKYAYLDEEGRYHAKFFFDRSDLKDGKATRPIRQSQPYGGPNYGLHMPLHVGTEVALGFVEGDPDRPISLGAVPNPATSSPVNSKNKSESLIRTATGHQIRLDDKEDKTVIDVTTHGKHLLSMNDDKDKQEIHLTTTDKNEMVMDDKNKNIRVMTPDGAHIMKMDYDKKVFTVETKYGHKFTMDDEAKKIALQTKNGHILALDDDKKSITIKDGDGKHVIQVDIGGSKVSITTDGDMEFKAKGSLNVEAKEITMEAKQGAFNAKAMKDVVMEGMNVSAKGKMKMTLEGGTEASLSGLQTKVEGKASLDLSSKGQAKLGGLQVSVAGQVMSEVKGAIVMIN